MVAVAESGALRAFAWASTDCRFAMTELSVEEALDGLTLHPSITPFTAETTCCRPVIDWLRIPLTSPRKAVRCAATFVPDPPEEVPPAGPPAVPGVVLVLPPVFDVLGDLEPPNTTAPTRTATRMTSNPTTPAR